MSNKMHTNPVCSQFIYPSSRGTEPSHWPSLASDWHFTWTTWYDILIKIITQCNSPIMIYAHDLDRVVSFGMCRVCCLKTTLYIINIQYLFDSSSLYSITTVYIPAWHKMLLPTSSSDTSILLLQIYFMPYLHACNLFIMSVSSFFNSYPICINLQKIVGTKTCHPHKFW